VIWPATADVLVVEQEELGRATPALWRPGPGPLAVGGCFVCFPRGAAGPGARGDPAWAAAVVWREGIVVGEATATGAAQAVYEPGLLALREGPLLEAAVRALASSPDVLLVDATGRDHPRRAGLALHLGAVLDSATVGVTHRPLVAAGEWPPDEAGARAPLALGDEPVGYWLRTRAGTRPLAVHAAWRTDPEGAVQVVLRSLLGSRTPEPLRLARTLARRARAANTSVT
jgi:deoxyribonuclease V